MGRKTLRNKVVARQKGRNIKQKKRKSKKNKNHNLNEDTAGALFPERNNPHDIYNLDEIANVKGSQSWLLYRDSGNNDVIIKKLGPAKWLTEDAIAKEIEATTKAGELGIGPEVVFSTIGDEEDFSKWTKKTNTYAVGYIVMKFINGRSLQDSDLDDTAIVDEINELLLKMHENGMKHDDLHNGNIMIGNIDDDEERVWIIDHSGSEPKPSDDPQTIQNISFESQ